MGYRRAIVLRWSTRDRLAVLVVAVTVAFLVGTTLLLFAAGGQAQGVAAEFESATTVSAHASPETAHARAGPDAVVVPVAMAHVDGEPRVVVGLPDAGTERNGRRQVRIGPTAGPSLGTLDGPRTVSLAGREGSVTLTVHPRARDDGLVPPRWYVTNRSTVKRLWATGAFVIDPPNGGPDRSATRLLGALAFFVLGTRQAVGILAILAGAGAILVGVTVYSVSRMGVRDRRPTIRLVRATGAPPRAVLTTFAARAAVLTAVGVGLGYALGVVVANGAVTLSVAAGLPTSLSVRVTKPALAVLAPLFAGLVGVGTLAGAGAAWSAARRPPATLRDPNAPGTRTPRSSVDWLPLHLLDWRALVPTVATLAAFVAMVVLVAGLAGVAQPIAAPDGATITQPGSSHPIASAVPAAYATALRDRGIAASGEILLFGVRGDQPFVARGANASAFRELTGARIVAGRDPTGPDEAAIGVDLARTLDVTVGDRVTLGGSTRPAFDRVEVVGMYAAPGLYDDQLLVSLATARHLGGVGPGQVQFVRAERLPDRPAGPESGVSVVDVAVPKTVPAGEPVVVRVTLRNDALERERATVRVRLAEQRRTATADVPSQGERTVTVRFGDVSAGTYRVRAGDVSSRVRVVDPDALRLVLPDPIPPGSEPLVRVRTAADDPVPNATVRVGNRTARTDAGGLTRIAFPDPGPVTVEATAGERSTSRRVRVDANATRRHALEVRVIPTAPTPLVRPTVRIAASNPWNRTVTADYRISGPRTNHTRQITLPPGDRADVDVRLSRAPPGTYTVRVRSDETVRAAVRYTVIGDDRLMSVLATSGRQGTTGIGQAAAVAFGNLRVLLGAVVLLAGGMTVGGTTATFARAVHARRRTIGIRRATGAPPAALLRQVLRDALLIGVVASVVATAGGLGILWILSRAGALVAFGIRIPVVPDVWLLATILVGAVGVTLLGAGLATVTLVRTPPAGLLAGEAWSGGDRDG